MRTIEVLTDKGEAPARAARLTCLIAEQTVGLTRQGLSTLVLSAETGSRRAGELGTIRAGLAEETAEASGPDEREALSGHLIAALVKSMQAKRARSSAKSATVRVAMYRVLASITTTPSSATNGCHLGVEALGICLAFGDAAGRSRMPIAERGRVRA
ncbi:hypothetical protein ABZ297_21485 [Nonomuraea sp. NPDC005983]|uniref:hypothetical protein n=1 Tax=Nonomuraea sp. NPDC005983 TaxID=3155595 RepID=UPI00339F1613